MHHTMIITSPFRGAQVFKSHSLTLRQGLFPLADQDSICLSLKKVRSQIVVMKLFFNMFVDIGEHEAAVEAIIL